jgi:hypothetical protein
MQKLANLDAVVTDFDSQIYKSNVSLRPIDYPVGRPGEAESLSVGDRLAQIRATIAREAKPGWAMVDKKYLSKETITRYRSELAGSALTVLAADNSSISYN